MVEWPDSGNEQQITKNANDDKKTRHERKASKKS
jgi:hypothetical protein